VARTPLTRKRLLGLDRSGGPPPATTKGQPLNPWTLPNAIGFARLALIPVYLAVALSSDDGRSVTAALIFAFIAGTDYLDGMTARITGQYSRLGALLDPLTDRALVISGVVVAWHFELLPRWALAVLVIRELLMLILTQVALRLDIDLNINMVGRWAVWPTMGALFLAMLVDSWICDALLYFGLVLTLWATALYFRDGIAGLRARPSSSD
jgi:CDP-diacylglycerol--glycerol-3-phosphate 3-phosphatidyltransferase